MGIDASLERKINGAYQKTLDTLTPKSILVVDDDPSVADALRLLLKIDGHEVEVAGDGETALAKHKVGNHDLVIADFLMPGMDGLELARLIKSRVPRQPIILVTAHSETVSNNETTRLQLIDALVAKPYSAKQLREALRTVFPHG
jgi:CheY-like chemotaxis protein